MLSAVRFDDELRLETGEIDDVRRDRMLSAKAPPELAAAQPVPKCPLRFGHVSAQVTCPPCHRLATSHGLRPFCRPPSYSLPRTRERVRVGARLAPCGKNFIILRAGTLEDLLSVLDLDRLRAAPLVHDPFEFVVVEEFLRRDVLASLVGDFPQIRGHGSYPVESLEYGPGFARLVAALTGAELRHAIEEKFGIDLSDRPTLLTLRGRSDGKDGHIHTDSASKIVTLLLYMNPVWEHAAGRLRLLRGPDDLEDYAVEVAPLAGTMLAFRRSERSFHGHRPHLGERRSLQLNWVTDPSVVRRELGRHRWSARLKALRLFGGPPP
jgi:SM-20-related protein